MKLEERYRPGKEIELRPIIGSVVTSVEEDRGRLVFENGRKLYVHPLPEKRPDYFALTNRPVRDEQGVTWLDDLLGQKILKVADTSRRGRYIEETLYQKILEECRGEPWETTAHCSHILAVLTDQEPRVLMYGGCGWKTPWLYVNPEFLSAVDSRKRLEGGGFEDSRDWHERALGKYRGLMATYQDRLRAEGVRV
ncbi:MAG: hypothetical protein JW727_04150 [Candidatus Aenigmarchaeota archaeon]|nr:hypothetical protein [Candidatus Aenigmarchaeota archaeon]